MASSSGRKRRGRTTPKSAKDRGEKLSESGAETLFWAVAIEIQFEISESPSSFLCAGGQPDRFRHRSETERREILAVGAALVSISRSPSSPGSLT
jgi:hypothetical protein